MNTLTRLARPKINLFLHVTGKRDDGYHLLESLVVFAESGDRVTAAPGKLLSLELSGPFGKALEGGSSNLVLRAAETLREWARGAGQSVPGAALSLEKNVPVASGIGGGSADAAAALNALCAMWELDIPRSALRELALEVGADVPVCLESRTQMMRGIGEVLDDGPVMPPAWVVLVNPMCEVSTARVFAALDLSDPSAARAIPKGFESAAALGEWLAAETKNDLEAPALMLAPEIGVVLDAIAACADVRLARMSGSGATCFGLFERQADGEAAEARLRAANPGWWVEAAALRA